MNHWPRALGRCLCKRSHSAQTSGCTMRAFNHADRCGVGRAGHLQSVRPGAQQHEALEQGLAQAGARRRLVHDHRPQLAVVAHQHDLK
jgi:hypothetical protein